MRRIALVVAAVFFVSVLGFAQQTAVSLPEEIGFEQIQGYEVKNSEGTVKGSVVDAVIAEDGSIPYAVVEIDQPVSFSGNQYLIAIEAVRRDTAPGLDTFSFSQGRLTDLPVLANNPIEAGGDSWDDVAEAFWQSMLGGDLQIQASNPVLASRLLNYRIVGQDGREYGRVKSIMLNPGQARVTALQLAAAEGEEALGAGAGMVPFDSVQINMDEETVVAQMDMMQEQLGVGEEQSEQTMGAEGEELPEQIESVEDEEQDIAGELSERDFQEEE